ncbi:hypothetical protein QL285_046930 [Trifolium repens]|nr:hypothetical protein QL285_046930 [Trifolium repens]
MGLFLGAGLDNPLMQGTQMELSSWISATAFSVMGTIKTRNHKYYCCRWMCYWRCNIISISCMCWLCGIYGVLHRNR